MSAEVHSLGEKPRAPALLFSLAAHLSALVLMVLFWRAGGPHVVPERYQVAQRITPQPAYLSSNSKSTQPHAGPIHMKRSTRHSAVSEAKAGQQGVYSGTLREQAVKATADIMHDLKFRQIYGFSPG